MRLLKNIAVAVGIACLATLTAYAQSRGFDTFQNIDFLAFQPTNIVGGLTGNNTNQPILVANNEGFIRMDFFAYTNVGTAGGVMTVTVQNSPDLTNWTTVANCGIITNYTTFITTNRSYGGSLLSTNQQNWQYTLVTPTAATAGFATPYGNPISYTNSATFACGPTGWNSIGFNADDALRYIRVIWTPSGSVSNWTVGSDFIANHH